MSENIFQGNEKFILKVLETDSKGHNHSADLISASPILLLTPETQWLSSKANRKVDMGAFLKPKERQRETQSKKIEEQISSCLGENNAYTKSIIWAND